MKKRALISVFDKSGITELAAALAALDWEIVSTGGTAAYLKERGVPVVDAAEVTGFPECLDGRVKTLHPAVHAGILARRGEKSHRDALERLNIRTIDLVAVNLYPFFQKSAAVPPLPQDEIIEFIDIGGPAMLRSAAKNFNDVIALCDPSDYAVVIESLQSGGDAGPELRKRLAGKVFNLTSAYDAAVSRYLLEQDFPPYYAAPLKRAAPLRYGENPGQKAALYLNADGRGAVPALKRLGGGELGYNNYRDADLALRAVSSFGYADGARPHGEEAVRRLLGFSEDTEGAARVACIAVKHNTPCGAALGRSAGEAFDKAYSCDTTSIFGGIVAFNTEVDGEAARKLGRIFLEVVIAPSYSGEAIAILREKPALRILQAGRAPVERLECVSVDGGLLVQETGGALLEKWEVVTKTSVNEADIPDMLFALRVVRWVKSNAVVVAGDLRAAGIGGGWTNRIGAAEQAIKAGSGTAHVLASDAFFPFPDVVEAAVAAGIRAIVQSGGSRNDRLSIDACDRHGIAMVFTGCRYFKH
ncbi:MAG: bifunctional phosphoribosylaminoimidazolecarboxamide formyltransferase/IMP cyclohydrolase [Spirochaetaceae bacterium]|jgi:phosphoribosylaminoimidazolecarboxamide formyltransferase/IMP cyclohydrolase|nr:bifunctional phosphoribosylaminoimidazolecarboxamide formyltransferase/IMP cyclohydrolase [Spirochaetaceae bacterium]